MRAPREKPPREDASGDTAGREPIPPVETGFAALDRLSFPIVVRAGDGCVRHANDAARRADGARRGDRLVRIRRASPRDPVCVFLLARDGRIRTRLRARCVHLDLAADRDPGTELLIPVEPGDSPPAAAASVALAAFRGEPLELRYERLGRSLKDLRRGTRRIRRALGLAAPRGARRAPIHPRALTAAVVRRVRRHFGRSSPRISTDLPRGQGRAVRADPIEVTRIVLSVLDLIDDTPCTIRILRVGHRIRFSVLADAPGEAPDLRRRPALLADLRPRIRELDATLEVVSDPRGRNRVHLTLPLIDTASPD